MKCCAPGRMGGCAQLAVVAARVPCRVVPVDVGATMWLVGEGRGPANRSGGIAPEGFLLVPGNEGAQSELWSAANG